jgi:flavin reductase (DIM6/NTAB) family NADH-FMN oxidoreductase RutF
MMRIDVSDLTAQEGYRLMTGLVIPRPIAWVSTLDGEGRPNLAPFSFFQGVGGDPPHVIVSIARHPEGERKDSGANALATGELVINIVSEDLVEEMNATAADVLPGVDEFVLAGVTPAASHHVRPPRVAEAPAALECRVVQTVPIGTAPTDYLLFVCEIVAFQLRDGLLRDGRVHPEDLRPLARLSGSGYARLGEIFSVQRPAADRTRP